MDWEARQIKSDEEEKRIRKLLKISDEKLESLRKKIRPIFSEGEELLYAVTGDPRKISYMK